jgi:hypothetical protein
MTGMNWASIRGYARVLMAAAALWFVSADAIAQEAQRCDEFLDSAVDAGPDACFLAEMDTSLDGRGVARLDVGLNGSARGFTVSDGVRAAYFTTAPEFVFVQTGSTDDWQPATVRYSAETGTGFALLFPKSGWNQKLWISVHGAGRSFAKETMAVWNQRVDAEDPLSDISLYEQQMLRRGFAVVKTFRSSDKQQGDCVATLDSGEVRAGMNITETPHIQLQWLGIAKRMLGKRLGTQPQRTYFYGHSAGGRNGRLINYKPGLNRASGGGRHIDGFLIDDAGTGVWLPVLLEDGKDVLFASDDARRDFAPQIDVTHQQYLAFKDEPSPEWVSGSYLLNKWQNAKILQDKGLGEKHRMYEVRGVSHSGGEGNAGRQREGVSIIPLWRVMDGIIERLDAWVDSGESPPATRADWARLSGEDADGKPSSPAIATPEVACPLGVYYPYPSVLGTRGVGSTGFAAFDGSSEEPLDGRGVFVDMNRNGYHDYRETVEQAWRRLGLLQSGESFNRERYLSCVDQAVRHLEQDGFLTKATAQLYRDEARQQDLPIDAQE